MGSFAPKGHASLDPQRPSAFANCERCGFLYLHSALRWDVQWYGNEIRRTGFLVCETCADVPNYTLRPKVLPADPVPILNPRREQPSLAQVRKTADTTRYTADSTLFTADNQATLDLQDVVLP